MASEDPQALDLHTLQKEVQDADLSKIGGGLIEIAVVMDCTGSMGSWIAAAKRTTLSTVHKLRENVPSARFRLGFVGYRDYCDEATRFVIVPMSDDVADVERRLQSVAASGGGDTCEDMAGGLAHALDLGWSADHVQGKDTRIIICVADAPPHGKQFHDITVDDNHPGADPDGRDLKAIVRDISSRGIDFYFMKITELTDQCIRVFNAEYTSAAVSEQQSFIVLNLSSQDAGPAPPSSFGTRSRRACVPDAPAPADEEDALDSMSESSSPTADAVRKESVAKRSGFFAARAVPISRSPVSASMAARMDGPMPAPAPPANLLFAAPAAPCASASESGGGYADAVLNAVLRSALKRSK